MTKLVIIGIEGENELWVADLDAGTIIKAPEPTGGALQAANELRAHGSTITKGVNLAVVAASVASLSGGYMDG